MSAIVSVIVVSHNTRGDLMRCLASARDHVAPPHQVVVVDNASTDGSVEAVRATFPGVCLIALSENTGFSRANNLGIRESRGSQLLLLNSDAEVGPGTVQTLTALLESRPEVAIVGPRTVDPDGTIQVSFGPDLTPFAEWRQRRLLRGVAARRAWAIRKAESLAGREHEPDWVSASCFLARKTAIEAVGGFDEGFFLYEEDVDLCVRLRQAGWRILYTPTAVVVHHRGRSMQAAHSLARFEYHRSHLRYYRKHLGRPTRAFLRLRLLLLAATQMARSPSRSAEHRAARSDAIRLFGLALAGRL